MFKPTEVPVIGEPPVPHRVNIISPNQIEFSKVLPVSRQAASTAPETTSRPAEAHPPVPATRKPARAQLMQTIEDQPGTATLVQPETVRGEVSLRALYTPLVSTS